MNRLCVVWTETTSSPIASGKIFTRATESYSRTIITWNSVSNLPSLFARVERLSVEAEVSLFDELFGY